VAKNISKFFYHETTEEKKTEKLQKATGVTSERLCCDLGIEVRYFHNKCVLLSQNLHDRMNIMTDRVMAMGLSIQFCNPNNMELIY